jgi:predicted  nucleic acid-binding Zn-ribbon protein
VEERIKELEAEVERLNAVIEQKQREVGNALEALKWTRDKLIESELAAQSLKWQIVSLEEGLKHAINPR